MSAKHSSASTPRQTSPYGVLIKACAGAGKTTALVEWYLNLLGCGEVAGRILATTFTRKAAHEIRDRILVRIAKGTLSSGTQVASFDGEVRELSSDECGEILRAILEEPSGLLITTMDSFFSKLAKQFSFELGIPEQWKIVDESEYKNRQATILQEMLAKSSPEEIVGLIRDADYHRGSHLAFKTLHSSIARFHQLYRGSQDRSWGAVAVPELPAESWSELVEMFSKIDLPKSESGKPHSSILKQHQQVLTGLLAGGSEVKRAEDFLCSTMVDAICDGRAYYGKDFDGATREIVEKVKEYAVSVVLNDLSTRARGLLKVLKHYDRSYLEALKVGGALSFGDLKDLIGSAAGCIELGELFYRLDSKIKHLLLDEFQDTSQAEWKAIQPLASEIVSKLSAENSLFCVGDTKQAIYGWRGGVAEIFNALEHQWSHITSISRDTNYRSTEPIISFVNLIFSNLELIAERTISPNGVMEWSEQFRTHTCARTEVPGYLLVEEVSQPDSPTDTEQGEDVAELADSDIEIEATAAKISSMLAQGYRGSVGVLMRDNQGVARVRACLDRHSVPSSEEGGVPLVDSPVLLSIVVLLHLLDHPGDTAALAHILATPLATILELSSDIDRSRLEQVLGQLRTRALERGYTSILDELLAHKELQSGLSPSDLLRFNRAIELIALYEGENGRIATARAVKELLIGAKAEDPSSSSVRVMTVHKSKGLEFDFVALPCMDAELIGRSALDYLIFRPGPIEDPEFILPSCKKEIRKHSPQLLKAERYQHGERMKEALSVLYVALTRARDALYIPIAKRPPLKGGEAQKVSRYSDIIRAVCSSSQGSVIVEQGDKDWWRIKAEEPVVSKPALDSSAARVSSLSGVRREFVRPARVKPSAAATSTSLASAGGAAHAMNLSRSHRERLGLMLHSALEHVVWIDDPEWGEGQSVIRTEKHGRSIYGALISRFGASERELGFIDRLVSDLWRDLERSRSLRKGYYLNAWASEIDELRVFTEFPFSILTSKEQLASGQIDRVVVGSKGGIAKRAAVIDFKLVALDAEDARIEQRYKSQIEHYVGAVAEIFSIDGGAIDGVILPFAA